MKEVADGIAAARTKHKTRARVQKTREKADPSKHTAQMTKPTPSDPLDSSKKEGRNIEAIATTLSHFGCSSSGRKAR